MSTDMLRHETAQRRGPVLALSGALAVLAFGALGAASGLQETVADLTDGFPEALMAFIPADVPGGYVVGEVFNLIAPLALVAFAVMGGASTLAGEEEAGTMAVLASLPVSRRGLLAAKAGALAVSLVLVTAAFVAVALLAEVVFDIGLAAGNVLATGLHLFLLAAFFGAVALATGAVTGNPTLASGVAAALAAVAYVADAMLPLADLDTLAELSPWYYYAGSVPLANGFDPAAAAVLLLLTVVMSTIAVLGFQRRDLRG